VSHVLNPERVLRVGLRRRPEVLASS